MNSPYNLPARHMVGIVGGAASGKDTVAGLFSAVGYEHISSSDVLREEVYRRFGTTSRELQTQVGNELRAAHGAGYWVDASVARLSANTSRAVISGLYCPSESQHFKAYYGGLIVGVVCGEDDFSARFGRLQARSDGSRDALDAEAFLAAHQRENSGRATHEANISKVLAMADYLIENTADLAHLTTATDDVIAMINRST